MVSSRPLRCGDGNREGHQDKTVLESAESCRPNRIIGLIKETREVAVGEKSVEQVSKRGRHCQTLVSGSHISPQCDLKQLSVMQWPPDRQRGLLCVCASERIESCRERDGLWQTTECDGESAGNLTGAFRHVVVNFLALLFLLDSPFLSWLVASDMMDVFIVSPGVPGDWWQSKG